MSGSGGWIKIHRSIREHWIWSSDRHSKQSAWIDLLMMVNHEDRKITIGNKVVIIHRGQVWTSYKKLKEQWRWSNDRMTGFIDSLVSDGMIAVNPTNTGTLITVLNYSNYQGSEDVDEEKPVRKPVRKSVRKPVSRSENKPVTNKKDIRMNKNDKKGAVPEIGDYEP